MFDLERVRTLNNKNTILHNLLMVILVSLLGIILGIIQKYLDSVPCETLPTILQQLDLVNYFGRLGIWILLATIISVYANSPLQAAIRTSIFFISMITGYYGYCYFRLGFLPVNYMIIWIIISNISFFLAYLCWYAKGEGILAIILSSIILGILFSQGVLITQGIYKLNESTLYNHALLAYDLCRGESFSVFDSGYSS